MKKVRYKVWDCQVKFQRYSNDRLAIQLVTEKGEPVAMATINLPFVPLADDEVLIKSYEENEGMLACLSDAKIIEPTGIVIKVRKNDAHICKLLKFDDVKASMH
ncbi:MAG: hypothetical protein ABFR65_11535 [Pseudomonadota bacterium]